MKKIGKILIVLMALDYLKLNVWQMYNIFKRVENGEDPVIAVRKQCAFWKDNIEIHN